MKIIHALEFQNSSKEEKLPYSTPDFPYIATLADLDKYRESLSYHGTGITPLNFSIWKAVS